MNMKNYGLTNTEMLIMELLWKAKEPMTFKEIMDVAVSKWKKTWKAQTLNTYLINLQKVGLIKVDKDFTHYEYYASCTKEQHIHNWTRKMVEDCFGNSFCSLVAAFIGEKKLTEEEAEELRKML